MPRKSKVVIIDESGERDAGKVFVIREMDAQKAEMWANKTFLELARAGVDVPPDIIRQGVVGITILAIRALGGVSAPEAIALMEEMFTCVHYRPDPNNEYARPPVGDDIEEVKTRWFLRKEIIELHTGFSFADAQSKLTSASAELPTKNTRTSRRSSARSSAAD